MCSSDLIVITRDKTYRVEGAAVCFSLEEALEWARRSPGSDEAFVIGGSEIFKLALPMANRIYLTEVKWPFEGDTFFPAFDEHQYLETFREQLAQDPVATLRVLDKKGPDLPWK